MEMENKPGFGLRPYDEELVGYYLRNKILGNHSFVEEAISEVVEIYSFDPWTLRYQSKIKSRDRYWYFFSRNSGGRKSRMTNSGSWKITVKVEDKWGLYGVAGIIGYKRHLVFQKKKDSKGIKSNWVMQEFHYTRLAENQRTYVVCRLEYKGDDKNILLENATDPLAQGSVVDQPLQENSDFKSNQGHGDSDMHQSLQGNAGSSNNTPDYYSAFKDQWLGSEFNMQQQTPYVAPYGDEFDMIWKHLVEENHEFLVDETMFKQNFCNHLPKNSVAGTVDSSDGSCNTPIILSSNKLLQGKEKVINKQKSDCEWKTPEDSIKKTPSTNTVKQNWIVVEEMSRRESQWIYLRNMIIGFLLFITIFGWIILVG